jgi:hypothetical protein
MKQQQWARPSLEALEDRWCPAVTASVRNGLLTVAGTPASAADTILVKETAANTFEVDDGGTVIASGLTGVSSVQLSLTAATDVVSVDLGGNTLTGNLSANLGGTATTLTVADGTISGRLKVSGHGSAETVTLGGTGTTLTVAGDSTVDLGSQAGNSLSVLSGVTFSDDFFIAAASATLAQGSTVTDTLTVLGGGAGTAVTVDGTVGGNLNVNSGPGGHGGGCGGGFSGPTARGSLFAPFGGLHGSRAGGGTAVSSQSSTTSLTLGSTGSVGGNLNYSSGGTGDSVDIAGTVSGSARVTLLGSGTLTVAGTIGTSGDTGTALSVITGSGSDTVSILDSAVINGGARLRLGSGTNTVSLQDAATVTGTLALQGGANTAFHGSTQTNHPTLDLSAFKGTQDGSANP